MGVVGYDQYTTNDYHTYIAPGSKVSPLYADTDALSKDIYGYTLHHDNRDD